MCNLRKVTTILLLIFSNSVHGHSRFFRPAARPGSTSDSHNCECGRNRDGLNGAQDKIVGGKPAIPNQNPWVVSLHRTSLLMFVGLKSSQFCGGSLISSSWVLTAAHCTSSYRLVPVLITVNMGDYNLANTTEISNIQRLAINIIMHPDYNSVTFDNDIALIKLQSPIDTNLSLNIRPICLPPPTDLVSQDFLVGQLATALGWGSNKEGGAGSSSLYQVTVPVLANEQCAKSYNSTGVKITPTMLCAGYPEGGRDTCQGDSGGPLQYYCRENEENGFSIVMGVVSFGIGCARSGFPGVYARVSQFVKWIGQQTQLEPCTRTCSVTSPIINQTIIN